VCETQNANLGQIWCKKGDSERHELHLSAAKQAQVVEAYHVWVLTKPGLHTPWRLFSGRGPLSLVKAVHMLDPALTTMHDMTFRREGHRRAVNHERVFTHVPRESEDFPRVTADFSFHKTKPSGRLWDAAGGALRGEHPSEAGKRHLQLGDAYNERRGGRPHGRQLRPVRSEHLIPLEKLIALFTFGYHVSVPRTRLAKTLSLHLLR
jgi:hypothetical protein